MHIHNLLLVAHRALLTLTYGLPERSHVPPTLKPHAPCVQRAPSRTNIHKNPIALGLIRPEIKAWMQSPLRQGTSPFSCTPGRGGFGRPRRREQRLAPHHSQYACLPFSSHTPPLPPNRARARNHSRESEFRPLLFDACFLQTSLLDAVEQARQWLKEQRLSDA